MGFFINGPLLSEPRLRLAGEFVIHVILSPPVSLLVLWDLLPKPTSTIGDPLGIGEEVIPRRPKKGGAPGSSCWLLFKVSMLSSTSIARLSNLFTETTLQHGRTGGV